MPCYNSLSEEDYALLFTINDKSTNLKEKMLEVMKPIIADLGPVNFMSIGAGTGNFEDDLIKRCGLPELSGQGREGLFVRRGRNTTRPTA